MDRYVAGEPAVYVLRSTAKKDRAYVGFTTNMNQRLRRHNGEIAHGASATRTGRPWQVEIIVVGFGSRSMALSFEWALHHPNKAVATRGALRSMPRPGSFYRKLAIAQHAVTQARGAQRFRPHPARSSTHELKAMHGQENGGR